MLLGLLRVGFDAQGVLRLAGVRGSQKKREARWRVKEKRARFEEEMTF